MAISVSRLEDLNRNWDHGQTIKFKQSITLHTLEESLQQTANEFSIPIAFKNDEITYGGIFNKKTLPCLVYYHPQHAGDYFFFFSTSYKQGLYTYVDFYYGGSSPNQGLINRRKQAEEQGGLKGLIKGAIIDGVSKNKNDAIAEEENWYQSINDVISEIIG